MKDPFFLTDLLNKEEYSLLEAGGLIHSFDSAFDLSLKTLSGYLHWQGIETDSLLGVIKKGYHTQIIQDRYSWLHMLEKRNKLSYVFIEGVAENAVETIKLQYYPALNQVYQYLKHKK